MTDDNIEANIQNCLNSASQSNEEDENYENCKKLKILASGFEEIDTDGNELLYPPEVSDFLAKEGKRGTIICH